MPSPTNNSRVREWSLQQKRAFFDLCVVGEQLVYSGIDYQELAVEIMTELKKVQETYIANAQKIAQSSTAEVPMT